MTRQTFWGNGVPSVLGCLIGLGLSLALLSETVVFEVSVHRPGGAAVEAFTATSSAHPVKAETPVGDLKVGEYGWTVPWAMDVLRGGQRIVETLYMVHPKPGGTVVMKVEMTSHGLVVSPPTDYEYSIDRPWPTWPKEYYKVSEVRRGEACYSCRK